MCTCFQLGKSYMSNAMGPWYHHFRIHVPASFLTVVFSSVPGFPAKNHCAFEQLATLSEGANPFDHNMDLDLFLDLWSFRIRQHKPPAKPYTLKFLHVWASVHRSVWLAYKALLHQQRGRLFYLSSKYVALQLFNEFWNVLTNSAMADLEIYIYSFLLTHNEGVSMRFLHVCKKITTNFHPFQISAP